MDFNDLILSFFLFFSFFFVFSFISPFDFLWIHLQSCSQDSCVPWPNQLPLGLGHDPSPRLLVILAYKSKTAILILIFKKMPPF